MRKFSMPVSNRPVAIRSVLERSAANRACPNRSTTLRSTRSLTVSSLPVPILAFAVLLLSSCGAGTGERATGAAPQDASPPVAVQAGAPGEPSRALDADEIRDLDRPAPGEADFRFVRGMIAHHEQALVMARLAPERAARDELLLLARRIDRSQREEIELMERWLEAHGAHAPDAEAGGGHADHAPSGDPDRRPRPHRDAAGQAGTGHALMPGMLTDAQLETLAEASGEAFDRLFLEFMIFHHQGALAMVAALFASEDGGQDGDIYQIASHIESDQRIEIERMRRMLGAR